MHIIGSKIIELEKTESTNDFASSLLHNDKQPEGTIVLTRYQTKGKGQGNNVWSSEKDKNILMSLILFPDFLPASKQFYLSETITLGIKSAIDDFLNVTCQIKWPNDIFLNNKKIGGILIQNSLKGQKIVSSIVGIGINVNQKEFDPALATASSLALETGKNIDKQQLFFNLIKELNEYYLRLKSGQSGQIKQEFTSNLLGFKQKKRFDLLSTNEKIQAEIVDIKESGEMVLDVNGERKTFMHGEIKMIV